LRENAIVGEKGIAGKSGPKGVKGDIGENGVNGEICLTCWEHLWTTCVGTQGIMR